MLYTGNKVERGESKRIRSYKIIYSGKTSTRNGVGIIMNEMKSKVVVIVRKSE